MYLIVVKHQFYTCKAEKISNGGWYQLLNKYSPYLEQFDYGPSEFDLNLLLNQKLNPILFNNKEEAKKVAKIAKIYEIAKIIDQWKPILKKCKFYVASLINKELEEV